MHAEYELRAGTHKPDNNINAQLINYEMFYYIDYVVFSLVYLIHKLDGR